MDEVKYNDLHKTLMSLRPIRSCIPTENTKTAKTQTKHEKNVDLDATSRINQES
jgi:hypothetical protein